MGLHAQEGRLLLRRGCGLCLLWHPGCPKSVTGLDGCVSPELRPLLNPSSFLHLETPALYSHFFLTSGSRPATLLLGYGLSAPRRDPGYLGLPLVFLCMHARLATWGLPTLDSVYNMPADEESRRAHARPRTGLTGGTGASKEEGCQPCSDLRYLPQPLSFSLTLLICKGATAISTFLKKI